MYKIITMLYKVITMKYVTQGTATERLCNWHTHNTDTHTHTHTHTHTQIDPDPSFLIFKKHMLYDL